MNQETSMLYDDVFTVRDGGEQVWLVSFGGRVCSPSWREQGPALAYLDALKAGQRQPEYRRA